MDRDRIALIPIRYLSNSSLNRRRASSAPSRPNRYPSLPTQSHLSIAFPDGANQDNNKILKITILLWFIHDGVEKGEMFCGDVQLSLGLDSLKQHWTFNRYACIRNFNLTSCMSASLTRTHHGVISRFCIVSF